MKESTDAAGMVDDVGVEEKVFKGFWLLEVRALDAAAFTDAPMAAALVGCAIDVLVVVDALLSFAKKKDASWVSSSSATNVEARGEDTSVEVQILLLYLSWVVVLLHSVRGWVVAKTEETDPRWFGFPNRNKDATSGLRSRRRRVRWQFMFCWVHRCSGGGGGGGVGEPEEDENGRHWKQRTSGEGHPRILAGAGTEPFFWGMCGGWRRAAAAPRENGRIGCCRHKTLNAILFVIFTAQLTTTGWN